MAFHPNVHNPESEAAFLADYNPALYPRPSVAVDLVIMTIDDGVLKVSLVRRDQHPQKDRWALPGGFVGIDESLENAALRVLQHKAKLSQKSGPFVEQLYTFGRPERDPRTRVISVVYFALVPAAILRAALTAEALDTLTIADVRTPWPGDQGGPVDAVDTSGKKLQLAFDHADMIGMAVKRLRGKLNYSTIGFELLPKEFTLRMLQSIHEAILGRQLNKDAFRRRMLATGHLTPTGKLESSVGHRPAELYRFRSASRHTSNRF